MGEPYYVAARDRWVGAIEAGWTARGTRRRLTVSARTERECRQKMKAKERELLLVGAPEENTRAGLTVKAWSDEWIPRQERALRPKAFATTRSYVTKWAIPTIGHKRLDRLSPGDVRSVALAMEAADLATSSIDRGHGELRRMLADAHADGHHVPERARNVELRRAKSATVKRRDALPVSTVRALLTTLEARPDRARWYLGLFAGMRPAEVRGLTWERVDFERDVIIIDWQLQALPYKVARDRASGFRVPRDYEVRYLHDAYHLVRPKTSSGWRVVPLTATLRSALEVWRDRPEATTSPYGLVFHDRGRALNDKDDRAAWRALLATAGLPQHDLYEARHTIASQLAATGAASADVTSVMGHSSILSTQAYLHGEVERARVALEAAELAMRGPSGVAVAPHGPA